MNFNQQFLYVMTLTLSIVSIVYYFYNIHEIDAQANRTQALTIQLDPGVVEFQPPVDTNTGQTIKLPGTLIGVKDPVTGQIIARDVKFVPPEVTGSSIIGTLDANGLFSRSDAPDSSFANPLPPGTRELLPPGTRESFRPDLGDTAQLFSQTNPTLTTTAQAASPTYNPPLMKCNTVASDTEGGYDIAKYAITGNLNKDRLKGDDFTFQIFSDLVEGDETEITGDDAPYKASILTDDGDKSLGVKLKEISTACVDTQHVVNLKKIAAINPEESDVFRSLSY
jgi:hypothetical protein